MTAAWIDKGLVMLSNHEPLTFRVRRGKQRVEEAAHFAYEHAEDFVERAAAFGITCLRTHYYKGGGLKYEAAEMRQTAAFVKLCHRHGIKVQGYVQHGTMQYETLFLEEPRAKRWVAVDQYGLKSSVTYGYQFFRYKPCFNQPGFTAYIKRVVAQGIRDGLDMFGFDNSAWSTEPVACQCPVCRRAFRRFLDRKYRMGTAAGRRMAWERFALKSFACVEPPNWHRWAMPINLFEIDDPMIMEWVDFKCASLRASIAEIGAHARKLKPDVVLEWNCYSAFGDNGPFWGGVDVCRNMAVLDGAYNEQDPFAGIDANGAFTGMYKLVILPNVKFISDAHVAALPAFAKAGGALLVTEETGAFDQWFRRRAAAPFAGQGKRVRHFPKFEHKRAFSYKPEDWFIDTRLWQRPANHKAFMAVVKELAGDAPVLEVQAPLGCVSTVFRKGDARIIHLLNYDTTKRLAGIAVRLRAGRSVKAVTLVSPEEGTGKKVAFRQAGGRVSFRVPRLDRYQVYVVK
ncbi:MAG: hypothetical protein ABIF71_10310 [Planctomycetota bacterium]